MTKDQIAKHIFARNPKLDTLHITSDGQAFHQKHQAEGHAGRLKDQSVSSIRRSSLEKVEAIKAKVRKITTPPATTEGPEEGPEKGQKQKDSTNTEPQATTTEGTPANTEGPEATEETPAETPVETKEAIPEATPEASQAPSSEQETPEAKSFPFLDENVGPASEEIKKVSSVEELDAIAAAEKAGEDRTGVRNAIEARRAQLTESNTQKSE